MRRLLLLTVPVLVLLAGCGSDEEQVRHTVNAIIRAANDHDADRLCELIIWDGDRESCQQAFSTGRENTRDDFGADARITNVVFIDGEAHVDLSTGDPNSMVLLKVGDRWLADPGS